MQGGLGHAQEQNLSDFAGITISAVADAFSQRYPSARKGLGGRDIYGFPPLLKRIYPGGPHSEARTEIGQTWPG